jgi:hypothetical protein
VKRATRAPLAGLLALVLAGTGSAAEQARPKDERDTVLRYHAYHVLVRSEDAAKKAHARIVSATRGDEARTLQALGSAARELSVDGDSAAQGGDLRRVIEGTLDERFEQAVLALEPGTLSAPLQSSVGWHVVYLAEKRAVPVSLLCGPTKPLAAADVARITLELGPSWRGPALSLAGTVSFLHTERSARGDAMREVTLHRELRYAVLVAGHNPPACYRSMRTRFVADCAREPLAGLDEAYFDARGAQGAVVDRIEESQTLAFDPVPASGGARQMYDAVCQSEPGA